MAVVGAIAAKQEVELTFKSLQKSPQRERILLLGAPTAGKTTCALTASAKFDPNKSGEGVLIDDIVVITADSAALGFARALKYEFAYWLDLSEHFSKPVPEFAKITAKMFNMANALAQAGKIHTVIFDNISTVDAHWAGALAKNFEGWALSEKLNQEHRNLMLDYALPLVCNLILIAHTKTINNGLTEEKRLTLGLEVGEKAVMDVSAYNAPKLYRAQTSARIPVKKITGKTVKDDQYNIYPRGVDGIESGSRYPQLEAVDKMKPDMKAVYALINQ